ncbi:MAG: hypothetical protein RLZZ260_394, partial [Actinomycetota bacterium]
MQILNDTSFDFGKNAAQRRSVVTIGAYDGVHRGHQTVIEQVRQQAEILDARSVVVTFDRHPASVVRPASAPLLLTDLDQKLELLAATGLDATCIVKFDEESSRETPSDFVKRVLVDGLAAKRVIIGEDFHFGHKRGGNVALLRELGPKFDFDVTPIELIARGDGVDEPVSSTAIRRALAGGQVELATQLLGHHFEVRGKVVHGDERGRTIGFPTANIEVPKAICILPRGTEESHEIVLNERSFLLTLGVPVRFSLVAATDDFRPLPGELVDLDEDRFQILPPLAVVLDAAHAPGHSEQSVRVVASLSEIGTLKLQCVAVEDSSRRWDIEFQLRGRAQPMTLGEPSRHPRLSEALQKIAQVFGKKAKASDHKAIKSLRNDLEKILGPRSDWETPLLRELFAALLDGLPHRRRSADHERVWFSLVGYCLRPGFGYPLDDWRVSQLFGIFAQGLQFVHETRNWAEWWTLWRRIAGGLGEAEQMAVFEEITPFINPETARRGNLPALAKKRSYEDMVRLVAVLERLPVDTKVDVGDWLRQRLDKAGEPIGSWWALGRVGGRVPWHGSAHAVVPKDQVERWLEW